MDKVIYTHFQEGFMSQGKTSYSKEFKIEAVRMVIDSNRRISDVAKELGLRSNLLGIWKKRYESGKLEVFPGKGHLSPEDSEIRRLKRENERLRMERDILKKAVAIFSEAK
jgi:transposase